MSRQLPASLCRTPGRSRARAAPAPPRSHPWASNPPAPSPLPGEPSSGRGGAGPWRCGGGGWCFPAPFRSVAASAPHPRHRANVNGGRCPAAGGAPGEREDNGGDGGRRWHGLPHTWGSQPPGRALGTVDALGGRKAAGGGRGAARGPAATAWPRPPAAPSGTPKTRVLLSSHPSGDAAGGRGAAPHGCGHCAAAGGISTCRKPRQEHPQGAGMRLGAVLCPQLCTLCCCISARPTRARAPRRAVTQPHRQPRYSPSGARMKF